MEFKTNILLLLAVCIDNATVNEMSANLGHVLERLDDNKVTEIKKVVRIVDANSNGSEKLYSYDKFIEILDNQGLDGLAS